MRKSNWLRKAAAGVLGFSMAVQAFPAALYPLSATEADESEAKTSENSNQMVSAPEEVYVSEYGAGERCVSFNEHWKFSLGASANAQETSFDDSAWRELNLPHDYSIEQSYSTGMEAESGYLPGGTGWYRKTFTVSPQAQGKKVWIYFDGVYMNATIYLNGKKLAEHPYGYTGFAVDLSESLNFEGENVLAVKVEHQTPSSRWYSGSGIYRDVSLYVTDTLHTDFNGVYVTTPELESQKDGLVDTRVQTTVLNDSQQSLSAVVRQTVLNAQDQVVGTGETPVTVAASSSEAVNTNVKVEQPELWSVDNPALYRMKTEIILDGEVRDTVETTFGYRYFSFDANTGFSLNGENTKLNGVCMHHDQGALGAVAASDAISRQVRILKEMGVNAIRVTHNPAATALLQACDEQGILVINELFDTLTNSKNGNRYDYASHFSQTIGEDNGVLHGQAGETWAQFDTRAAVESSRNSPSVIMYSLGNELLEGISGSTSNYPQLIQNLVNWVQEADPTRSITFGDNYLKNNNATAIAMANVIAQSGGTIGYNYATGSQLDAAHSAHPDWMIYGSESASSVNSRGIYDRYGSMATYADKQLSAYDTSYVSWGHRASDVLYTTITRDFVAGEFVWTGFDYLGEPTPWNGTSSGAVGSWESPKNSYFGIVDTAGLPKDSYYLYQSQWNDNVNTLHVLPAWNSDVVYKDGNGNVPVVVYSDAAAVELFFTSATTGQRVSLGKKEFTKYTTPAGYTYQIYEGADKSSTTHENLYLKWNVPYADGVLEAVAYDENGEIITDTQGRNKVETAGQAAKLEAQADRTLIEANGTDLSYVTVEVKDANGVLVPNASNVVTFTVEGDGELVGVDNGSSPDHQPYSDDNRQAFSGKVVAIVRSTKDAGSFTVTASADGLESASVQVTTLETEESAHPDDIQSLIYSRMYYVQTGTMPSLAQTVEACYADGHREEIPVLWNEIDPSTTQSAGTFTVAGVAGGMSVQVTVNVIDSIGALLNYSTGVMKGTVPVLPTTRPAVLPDGTVLSTSFAVSWQMPDASAFDEEGTVVIPGSAEVFGNTLDVQAVIRVSEAEVTIGNSLSAKSYVSQSIPEGQQSDTLAAIIDGSTAYDPDSKNGDDNLTAWSNYNYCFNNPENNTAELTFRFDTQQFFGQFVVHFCADTWSASNPDAETTWFEVSEDGVNWTRVDATETIGTTANRVTPYTYDFAPVQATFVRVHLTNTTTKKGNNNPCICISEVELKQAVTDFALSSTATLSALQVNGKEISAAELATGTISVSALKAEVEATAADNGAVTVLPAQNREVLILVTSEDGLAQSTYRIRLGVRETGDPADDQYDIPASTYTVDAASANALSGGVEGPVSLALDGDASTYWHTNWANGHVCTSDDDRWYSITLEEPTWVDAWRYQPRDNGGSDSSGGRNGFIGQYSIQYREDGEWKTAATGEFDYSIRGWQMAVFDEPVKAQEFRIVAHTSYNNGIVDSQHVSAAEFRLRAPNATMLQDAQVDIDIPQQIEVEEVSAQHPVTVQPVVVVNGVQLTEDVDYICEYAGNTDFGTATLTIVGLGDYCGSVQKTFEIVQVQEPAPEQNANKVLLKAAIDYAQAAMSSEEYANVHEKVKAALEKALNRAIEVYEDERASQAVVNQAWSELCNILHMLDFTSSKMQLAELVSLCEDIDLGQYVDDEAVKQEFLDALAQAREVLENPDALDETSINPAYERLLAAKEALEALDKKPDVQIDTSRLAKIIALTEHTDLDKYLDLGNTKAEFTSALAHAREVLADPQSQEEVDAATMALSTAYLNLRLKPNEGDLDDYLKADKELLKSAIDYALQLQGQEDYDNITPATKAIFEEALAKAQDVYDNENATQEEVDEAYNELLEAIHSLNLKGDKSELEQAIEEAETLNPDDYVDGEDVKAEFEEALEHAREVAEDENATDEDVQEALTRLEEAMDALKGLEKKPDVILDVSVLERLIRLTQDTDLSLYVQDETIEAFSNALIVAKAQLENPESQSDIDMAVNGLSNAYMNLRLKADEELLKALQSLKELVENATTNLYSQEELAQIDAAKEALSHALSDVDRLGKEEGLALLNAHQDVAALIENRENATPNTSNKIEQLVTAPSKQEAAGAHKAVSTAASAGIATATGIFAAAGAALLGLLKKKKK